MAKYAYTRRVGIKHSKGRYSFWPLGELVKTTSDREARLNHQMVELLRDIRVYAPADKKGSSVKSESGQYVLGMIKSDSDS